MTIAKDANHSHSNRILAALPKDEYERLLPSLKYVELPLNEVLYEPDKPLPYVYFPYHGLVSFTTVMEDGLEIEVGSIGREGMVGLPIVMGADSTPLRSVMQIAGEGMRMKSKLFRVEVSRCNQMSRMLLQYEQAFFIQTALTAACNRLHRLNERLARWLLMARERANSDELQLKQVYLSMMLGVSRASVSAAASQFQADGLIQYSRGRIRILDQLGLEAASCACYGTTKKEFDRLLG